MKVEPLIRWISGCIFVSITKSVVSATSKMPFAKRNLQNLSDGKKCTCMHEFALIVMSSKLCRSLLKDIARGLLRKYRYFVSRSPESLPPCAIQFDQFSSIIFRRKRGNATLESDIYLICPSDLNVCVRVRHDLWSQWKVSLCLSRDREGVGSRAWKGVITRATCEVGRV